MVRRRVNSYVRLRLFLVSRIEGIHFLKLWSVDDLILLSAWGFFSYHILKGYISWSDGASTTWFFCPPEAFSRITYWRDTFLEAVERRRLDSSVRLRLFLYYVLKGYISWSDGASTSWFLRPPKAFFVLRIEGIRIWRGMGVKGRRCAVTWDWRQQNKKRSRMRLSSGSLRFSRRHCGALCAV